MLGFPGIWELALVQEWVHIHDWAPVSKLNKNQHTHILNKQIKTHTKTKQAAEKAQASQNTQPAQNEHDAH